MKTDIRIINGHQIGGCITVISDARTKIIIDFGESLPGSEINEYIDFDWKNERIDAVFFTHYHGDHTGRLSEIPDYVPIYMGEITYNVMLNINERIRDEKVLDILNKRNNIHFIEQNRTVKIGTIEVTPYGVDHSAFDAYMFLVHANDEYILHTGDYRDHGHKGHTKNKDGNDRNVMLDVIRYYVTDKGRRRINALITEGTMMTRLSDENYSEKDMLNDATEFFKDNRYVFLKISSTNVDSLATFEKAAKANGFKMYCSGYLLDQISIYRKASEKYQTTMYSFDNVYRYPLLPKPNDKMSDKQLAVSTKQREEMRKEGFLIVVDGSTESIIDEFSDLPTIAIYSMWRGYINPEHNAFNSKLYDFCQKTNAINMHTSGHAYPELIKQVIEAVNPTESIIPIHTEAVDEFMNLDISQEIKEKIMIDEENVKSDECIDNLLKILQRKYNNRSIRWPKAISLTNTGENKYLMTLDMRTVMFCNMQEADNAFEGWAVSAFIGFGTNSRIILDTNKKIDIKEYEGNGHLCRFLYRAMKFSEQYYWFELSDKLQSVVDNFREYLISDVFTNNLPNNEAGVKNKRNKEDFAETRLSENGKLRKQLSAQFDIGNGTVHRQLPVGLFRKRVTESNMIFTSGKSAIDMWSIENGTFQLFELKADNKMVGVVTEIFFYSNYIRDLKIDGGLFSINTNLFCDVRGYNELFTARIDSVKGILLADKFHPLVNDELIDVLNNGTEKCISYTNAKYDYNSI